MERYNYSFKLLKVKFKITFLSIECWLNSELPSAQHPRLDRKSDVRKNKMSASAGGQ
jgi:hypothetical protein